MSQLEAELRREPGSWEVREGYVLGTIHPRGSIPVFVCEFLVNQDKVAYIRQGFNTGHGGVLPDGSFTGVEYRPWIDADGKIHPEVTAPDTSKIRVLTQFVVEDPEKYQIAIGKLKKEWHRRHPGVRVRISYPGNEKVSKPRIAKSSGRAGLDNEALQLSRRLLPELAPERPTGLGYSVELE